jgi:alanine dehydrogenase
MSVRGGATTATAFTVGFPRMHKETGERRVFLPEFVDAVSRLGVTVLLEEGYGDELQIPPEEYLGTEAERRVRFVSREESFAARLVIVLRSPEREEFALLKSGSCLLSMLHFPTRSWRVTELSERGVNAVAMDQIVDDQGRRLVENLDAVAWNGVETAFDVLSENLPGLTRTDDQPVSVVVMGTGAIGQQAVNAAVKYGSLDRRMMLMAAGHPGVICMSLGRSVTGNASAMERVLSGCDILVDATQRRDASRPVVPNSWISWLPRHAVVADLCVDPYLLADTPPVVRAIEGIPRGNLDHYVFAPDDPEWNATIPASIPTAHRRHVVSCYSWPGIHPQMCMRHYARQLLPVVQSLILYGYDGLSERGDLLQRAVYRGSLMAYVAANTPRERISRTVSTGIGGEE